VAPPPEPPRPRRPREEPPLAPRSPVSACAGRGIIVHHEPVFKHRAPQNDNGGDRGNGGGSTRGRRGRGGGAGAAKNGHGSSGTHAITEDVRNALAQIAKSTVPHTDTVPAAIDAEPGTVEQAAEAAAEAAVEILDIPVKKSARAPRRISTEDAEEILGSVLEALPEPSSPGTGRGRRSRRAGSSGAVVTPEVPEASGD
jgi:ribonuclease E